jgi:hypothetical protein
MMESILENPARFSTNIPIKIMSDLGMVSKSRKDGQDALASKLADQARPLNDHSWTILG